MNSARSNESTNDGLEGPNTHADLRRGPAQVQRGVSCYGIALLETHEKLDPCSPWRIPCQSCTGCSRPSGRGLTYPFAAMFGGRPSAAAGHGSDGGASGRTPGVVSVDVDLMQTRSPE